MLIGLHFQLEMPRRHTSWHVLKSLLERINRDCPWKCWVLDWRRGKVQPLPFSASWLLAASWAGPFVSILHHHGCTLSCGQQGVFPYRRCLLHVWSQLRKVPPLLLLTLQFSSQSCTSIPLFMLECFTYKLSMVVFSLIPATNKNKCSLNLGFC